MKENTIKIKTHDINGNPLILTITVKSEGITWNDTYNKYLSFDKIGEYLTKELY